MSCNGEDRQGKWEEGGRAYWSEEEAGEDENCEISRSLIKALM